MKNITIDITDDFKQTKIRNEDGWILFIVISNSVIIDEITKYQVRVLDCTHDFKQPTVVIDQIFDEKKMANSVEKELIGDYKALVDDEQEKKPNPRDVFDSAVNYHEVKPQCCYNCLHSVLEEETQYHDCVIPRPRRLYCTNCKNIRCYEDLDREFNHEIREPKEDRTPLKIKVEVYRNGICDNYKAENKYL